MKTHVLVPGVLGGMIFSLTALLGSATATADDRCTNQINYAGDPRSNVVINSIGASTGQCPTPIPQQYGLPGLVDGAVAGQPCYNYPLYIFGQDAGGRQYACLDQGTNTTGLWVTSIPVIGERQIGGQCASEQQYAAQSPSGQPLVCDVHRGWVQGP